MSTRKPLYIFGAGGHAKVVKNIIDNIQTFDFEGFIEKSAENNFLDKNVGKSIALAIGLGENHLRQTIAEKFKGKSLAFPSLVHPCAVIAEDATINEGAVVMAGAVINPGASIGAFSIVNSGAVIEHDCQVGDFASIASKACLCGNVRVGHGAYVGAGATIIQKKSIGKHAVLGAGGTALENIDDYVISVGVPAKTVKIRKAEESIY